MKSPLFVALICFIWVNFSLSFTFFFANLFLTVQGQVAVWSWFPPPTAWEASRSGCNWLAWTQQCEDIFQNILSDVCTSKAKLRAQAEWVSRLHGQQTSHTLIKLNNSQLQAFMDGVVPVGN